MKTKDRLSAAQSKAGMSLKKKVVYALIAGILLKIQVVSRLEVVGGEEQDSGVRTRDTGVKVQETENPGQALGLGQC